MNRGSTQVVPRRTPDDLIQAAELGARLAVRMKLADGQDQFTIRREVITRFREDLQADSYGTLEDETLMAAVQRAVEAVLDESSTRED